MPGERCLACMEPLQAGLAHCPKCGSSVPCPPNPPDSLQPGYLLGNRFTIGKVIGRGGYGISYIAYDNRLQTTRCIKEYFPQKYRRRGDMSPLVEPGHEQEFQRFSERFLQEARIMSAMSEEKVSNVVNVYDQLNLNGTTYILMEYLKGTTLDEYITSHGKGLPWEEAVRDMKAVVQTLEEIHRHGYLHRDISLSNIFRMQDGSVRVIDFGSAEPIDTAKNDPGKMWPSSKRYYSPEEQINNSAQGPWTDIYAAGVCLFKAVAGGWPSNQRNGEPYPSLRALGVNVPESLDKVINHATQREPKRRYASAAAMLEALNRIETAAKSGHGGESDPRPVQIIEPIAPSDWQKTRMPKHEEWSAIPVEPDAETVAHQPEKKKKNPVALIAVLAAVVVIGAGTAILLLNRDTDRRGGGIIAQNNTSGGGVIETPTPEPKETRTEAPREQKTEPEEPENQVKGEAQGQDSPTEEQVTATPEPETATPEPETPTSEPEPETATPEPETPSPTPEPTPRTEHTVIWLNGDGSELDRRTYLEGDEEPTTDRIPTKAEDEDNTYAFTGWDDGTVDGNTKTYHPNFTAVAKPEYTVIWLNEDGSELDRKTYKEGAPEPKTDKIPEKAADEDNTYVFAGWDDGTVDGNEKIYRPTFRVVPKTEYTVIWLNGDGSELDSKTYKEGAEEPTTDKIPEKAADEDNTYVFTGWDNGTVNGNVKTYRPQFEAVARPEYTVIWLDGDGSELDRRTYKEGAEEPTTDKIPTKAEDEDNTYAFTGWDEGTVDGNEKTYHPQFKAVPKPEYTVIWLNGDGSELDRRTYKEGQEEPKTDKIPVKEEDEENTYTFIGWDEGTVEGDTKTYRPRFEAKAKPKYDAWYVRRLDVRQDDSGTASYSIQAVSAQNTEVKAWIVTAEGEKFKEIPMERVDASDISVPDGLYVHADIGWTAKDKLQPSEIPEGESFIRLVLMENGEEKESRTSDPMTRQSSAGGQSAGENRTENDQLGYICYVDDLSRMTFDVKKGKVFITGFVYSDAAMVLNRISYSIDGGEINGNAGNNVIQKGRDRSDAAAARQELEASGFTVGSKNQGCFIFELKNMKRLEDGSHELVVSFMFANGEVASCSTRFSITNEEDDGEIVKDAKTMLNLMGYQ